MPERKAGNQLQVLPAARNTPAAMYRHPTDECAAQWNSWPDAPGARVAMRKRHAWPCVCTRQRTHEARQQGVARVALKCVDGEDRAFEEPRDDDARRRVKGLQTDRGIDQARCRVKCYKQKMGVRLLYSGFACGFEMCFAPMRRFLAPFLKKADERCYRHQSDLLATGAGASPLSAAALAFA